MHLIYIMVLENNHFIIYLGDYGKLGHGNNSTQKYPKLVQGPLCAKVTIVSYFTWM